MMALPFYLTKGEDSVFFLYWNALPPTREIYCLYTEKPTQAISSPIVNPNSRTFGTEGKIVWAGSHHRPDTLLAGMDAAFAALVILAPAVLAQKKRPFQTPFLAPTHKSSIYGGFFCRVSLSVAFHSAHSRYASSSRSPMKSFYSDVVLRAWTAPLYTDSTKSPE